MNFYNRAMLNPNLKTKICYHLIFFLELQFVFFLHFLLFLLYFTSILNGVTGSDGLKLSFHVEMNIRNSKIAVRMLYEKKLHAIT